MSGSILKSAFIIVAVTMVGRLLGLIRNMFLTNQFGTGMESTAYTAAFTIPLALSLVVPGAVNSILIPTLKGKIIDGDEAGANALFHKVLTALTVFFIVLTVVIFVFADPIISLMVPSFSEETHRLTVELFRYMAPSALFIGLFSLFSSVLNVHNEFFIASLGTVVNSLIVIVSYYVFVPFMEIQGLALGTLLGFVGFALVMVPALRRFHYSIGLNLRLNDPEMKAMGERLIPIVIGSTISQLTMFLERFFASGIGEAKLTVLTLANQIMQVPMAVFVGAFTLPLFPLLAEYVKKQQMDQMKHVLEQGLLYLVILLLPVTVGLILLSAEITALFYERGEFGPADTALTAWALIFYSLGILGLAFRDLFTRAFYAMEDTKTPVMLGAGAIVLYVLFVNLFIPLLDHGGIAFAASLSAFCNAMALAFLLRRKVGSKLLSSSFYVSTGKAVVASTGMGLIVWLGKLLLAGIPLWLSVPFIIAAGAGVYLLILLLLKEELAKEMLAKVKRKTSRA
ncbi:murein biosynthesis integral membrane protein MurJ [Aneurinibacillus tyrosinisolvens]|uniref:murein biosynthesis integral membrane protein MurJ n=1 Tax=Aneurinibacillus tyrosinisolvens TaxID=1443435 RepID=UPI00063F0C08|nr:murein biosynthesis integral membrane protein MurJ [Aneurinibacillus tyrosinisolvens]